MPHHLHTLIATNYIHWNSERQIPTKSVQCGQDISCPNSLQILHLEINSIIAVLIYVNVQTWTL